jgi:ATP-dependent RNA helicase RhlE
MYQVGKDQKLPLLGKLLKDTSEQVLVFSRTKHGANNLVKKLAQYDVTALAIHGNKSQPQRTKALADFKANRVQVLVATDIAARGIDIDELALVINFDMPQVPEDYVHRIGRTGRAGASGSAVSLVSEDEIKQLRAIERLIHRKIEKLDFDPSALPARKAGAEEPERAERQQRRPQSRPQQRTQGQGQSRRQGAATPAQHQQRADSERQQAPRRGNRGAARTGSARSESSRQPGPRAGTARGSSQRSGGSRQGSPREVNGNVDRDSGNTQPKVATAQSAGFWQKLRNSLPGINS